MSGSLLIRRAGLSRKANLSSATNLGSEAEKRHASTGQLRIERVRSDLTEFCINDRSFYRRDRVR